MLINGKSPGGKREERREICNLSERVATELEKGGQRRVKSPRCKTHP